MAAYSSVQSGPGDPPARRGLSAFELLIGAALVIGHNVLHVLPNEVLILPILAIVSMRLRDGRFAWSSLGFKRPNSWTRIVVIAVAAAALRLILGELVIDPLTAQVFPAAHLPAGAAAITGNPGKALQALGLIWSFAAFGEEISYRGYLLNRAAEAGGGTTAAFWAAAIVSAVLFGYGHYYKGPAGVIDSGVAGLILAIAYLASGRNLWTCVIAHGLIDTVGVAALYFGAD